MAVKFGFVKEAAFQLIPWQVGLIIRKVKAMWGIRCADPQDGRACLP